MLFISVGSNLFCAVSSMIVWLRFVSVISSNMWLRGIEF